jgi:hypothetical protein
MSWEWSHFSRIPANIYIPVLSSTATIYYNSEGESEDEYVADAGIVEATTVRGEHRSRVKTQEAEAVSKWDGPTQ